MWTKGKAKRSALRPDEVHNHPRQTLDTSQRRTVANRSRIDSRRSLEPKDSCPLAIIMVEHQESSDERKGKASNGICDNEQCQSNRKDLEKARFKMQQIEKLVTRSLEPLDGGLRKELLALLSSNP